MAFGSHTDVRDSENDDEREVVDTDQQDAEYNLHRTSNSVAGQDSSNKLSMMTGKPVRTISLESIQNPNWMKL